jgi:hypothetical protein
MELKEERESYNLQMQRKGERWESKWMYTAKYFERFSLFDATLRLG